MPVELGDDQVSDLRVSMYQQFSDQELSIPALRQLLIIVLELVRDLLPLFQSRVLQSGLDNTDRVMLEHKVPDPPCDYFV